MYTRIVEITSKSGKSRELCSMIEEKVVPILKKQTGFVDETVLVSDTESNQVLGLSFWNSKEDAERYHEEQYPKVHEMLQHLMDTEPAIRTFDVQASTTRQITARRNLQNRIFGRSKADAGERAFVSAATDRHPTERSFARLTPTRHYDVAGRVSSG